MRSVLWASPLLTIPRRTSMETWSRSPPFYIMWVLFCVKDVRPNGCKLHVIKKWIVYFLIQSRSKEMFLFVSINWYINFFCRVTEWFWEETIISGNYGVFFCCFCFIFLNRSHNYLILNDTLTYIMYDCQKCESNPGLKFSISISTIVI